MKQKFFLQFSLIVFILMNNIILPQENITNTANIYQTVDRHQNDSGEVNKRLGIQIRGGLKFSESSSYSFATKKGFYGGISFLIPLSNTIDLQPELNYSNSPSGNIANNNITVKEFGIMLSYKYNLGEIRLKLLSSLAILSINSDKLNSDNEKLLALNLGLGVNKKIFSSTYLTFELRKQWAASFNTGGGNTFNPFILNLGILYIIPKTINK